MHKKFLKIVDDKLICTIHVPKNMVVFSLQGKLLCNSTKISVHIGDDVHIEDSFGTHLTHSFDPNCIINGFKVIALKNIIPGDVLTYNFNKYEYNMACPFFYKGILVKGNNTS